MPRSSSEEPVAAEGERFDLPVGHRALEHPEAAVGVHELDPLRSQAARGLFNRSGDFVGRFDVVDESLWQPHAVSIGLIGRHLLNDRQFADLDNLEPVYIRLSYAEEKRRETAAPNAIQ